MATWILNYPRGQQEGQIEGGVLQHSGLRSLANGASEGFDLTYQAESITLWVQGANTVGFALCDDANTAGHYIPVPSEQAVTLSGPDALYVKRIVADNSSGGASSYIVLVSCTRRKWGAGDPEVSKANGFGTFNDTDTDHIILGVA